MDLFEFFERERRKRFRNQMIWAIITFVIILSSIFGFLFLWKELIK